MRKFVFFRARYLDHTVGVMLHASCKYTLEELDVMFIVLLILFFSVLSVSHCGLPVQLQVFAVALLH